MSLVSKKNYRQYLSNKNYKKLINILKKHWQNFEEKQDENYNAPIRTNELILIEGRINYLERQQISGQISRTDYLAEQESINDSLSLLIDRLPDEFFKFINGNQLKNTAITVIVVVIAIAVAVFGYNKFVDSNRLLEEDVSGLNANMVEVEGGRFQIGDSGEGAESDESPFRQILIRTFKMSRYEVTQEQWTTVMGAEHRSLRDCTDCPVTNVSWDQVQEFIKRLNYRTGAKFRLPSESEWEYAARETGTSSRFPGTGILDSLAWYVNNSANTINPVGQKRPNTNQLYDMAGNVWEWCQDSYHKDYSKIPDNGSPYEQWSLINNNRVRRGGAFNSAKRACRISDRHYAVQDSKTLDNTGFRLAMSIED